MNKPDFLIDIENYWKSRVNNGTEENMTISLLIDCWLNKKDPQFYLPKHKKGYDEAMAVVVITLFKYWDELNEQN